LRKAGAEDLAPAAEHLERLGPDELALVKLAAQFPRTVEAAAQAREPHRIAFFLYDLAAAFHAFWNMGNDDPAKRIIVAHDRALSGARLFLGQQIGQVIRNGLAILGVEAVEEL
jgi:arginyl-tRNA synthetase